MLPVHFSDTNIPSNQPSCFFQVTLPGCLPAPVHLSHVDSHGAATSITRRQPSCFFQLTPPECLDTDSHASTILSGSRPPLPVPAARLYCNGQSLEFPVSLQSPFLRPIFWPMCTGLRVTKAKNSTSESPCWRHPRRRAGLQLHAHPASVGEPVIFLFRPFSGLQQRGQDFGCFAGSWSPGPAYQEAAIPKAFTGGTRKKTFSEAVVGGSSSQQISFSAFICHASEDPTYRAMANVQGIQAWRIRIMRQQSRKPHIYIYPSIHLIYLSIHLSVHVCMYVSIYLSIHVSIHLCIYLSIYLSIYPCMYKLSIFLSAYTLAP